MSPRIGDKPLSELTDAELQRELLERRRRRGYTPGREPATQPPRRSTGIPGWKVRQWYRNLELAPGATSAEVEAAYEALMARYDPKKHAGNPEKHRAAMKLAAGLQEAHEGLRRYFASR